MGFGTVSALMAGSDVRHSTDCIIDTGNIARACSHFTTKEFGLLMIHGLR